MTHDQSFHRKEKPQMLLTQVPNGLQLGSIYTGGACSPTVRYHLLLNFAHGDTSCSASRCLDCACSVRLNPAIAVLLAIFGCIVLGVLIIKVYAPLREAQGFLPF